MTDTPEVFDPTLPPVLADLHRLKFDYAEGEGIDFEPYAAFTDPGETRDWFAAWTGEPGADPAQLRVFGQDGTGGLAAFWRERPGQPLSERPVVFLGSEGEAGVVARNLDDYLWLLAAGHGPYEAVAALDDARPANAAFTAFARRHAAGQARPASAIVEAARAACPGFASWLARQCPAWSSA